MKSLKLVLATLLLTAVSRVRAKPEYKKFIPNADAFLKEIGDERALCAPNIFGQAFAEAGYRWTKALCEADTDNDGRQMVSNWVIHSAALLMVVYHYDFSLSHPGDVTST